MKRGEPAIPSILFPDCLGRQQSPPRPSKNSRAVDGQPLNVLLGHVSAACAADIPRRTHFLSFDAAAKPSGATITNPDICRPRMSASVFGYAAQAHEHSGGICQQIGLPRRSGLAAGSDHDEE